MAAVNGLERGTEFGQGLFSLGDLSAYLVVSGERQDGDRTLRWLTQVLNPVDHQAKRPDYSFGDLISLFVVRELLSRGVRSRVIREAEEYLRRKWKTDRPFVSDEIQTDGCGVFVDDQLVAGGQIESADLHGQQVLREAVRERLVHVHYDEGVASSWEPASEIRVDPTIQFGDPVIDGTRIPTEAVADMASWASVGQVSADLGIAEHQVKAALAFERRLAAIHN